MTGAHLRVGLMLLAGLALGVTLVLFLGGNRVGDGLVYETYMGETVQGLDVGSPVKFRGVQLGQVNAISLAPATYANVPHNPNDMVSRLVVVRFAIDPKKFGGVPDTAQAIAAGLRVRLASQGITGLAYLELDFVAPSRYPQQPVNWKPDHTVIPSMPSTISQFQDAAQALAAKLQDVDIARLAAAAQTLIETAQGQLGGGELRQTFVEAALLLKTLRGDAESADLAGLVAEMRETVATLRGLAGGPQSQQLLAASARTAERLGEAVARMPALVTALETAVRRLNHGTSDAQAELLPALRDARAAAANLRDTSETLRRNPSSVLLGAPPPKERP